MDGQLVFLHLTTITLIVRLKMQQCDLSKMVNFLSGNIHARCVYKVVLTGGPCGGKTTGQDRLGSFFEQLGWKVYRVPETATVLINGGVK
jgi:hypothetical protein